MRIEQLLTLSGKKAVFVGADNKLPELDATNLIKVEKAIEGKNVEILDVMPVGLTTSDIGRCFLYTGTSGQYEKDTIYKIVYGVGVYSFEKITSSADLIGLPEVSSSDNGKILSVVNGVWVKDTKPVSATSDNVKSALGMSGSSNENQVLNRRGNYVTLPTVVNYTSGNGIDINGAVISVANEDIKTIIGIESGGSELQVLSKSGVYVDLPSETSTEDIKTAIGINSGGDASKFLSQTGSWEVLFERPENILKTGMAVETVSEMPEAIEENLGRTILYMGVDGDFENGSIYSLKFENNEYFWEVISASIDMVDVKEGLGIKTDGSVSKVLNEKGQWVVLPEGITYTGGTGVDITNNVVSIDTTGALTGQVLKKTSDGVSWADDEKGQKELPDVSVSDNGKVLLVSGGVWSKGDSPISATSENVKTALGVSGSGDASKVLNQKGEWIDAPSGGTPSTGGSTVKGVISKNTNYQLNSSESSSSVVSTTSDEVTFTLPTGGEPGTWFTFVKMGTGKFVVKASGSEKIMDSSPGGTLFCDLEATAVTCILEKVTLDTWVITSGTGMWETT